MMVTFKDSVRLRRLTPALKRILDVLFDIDGSTPWLPPDLVVTSLNDSTHGEHSRHYTDEAADVRTHNFAAAADAHTFRDLLAHRLGQRFTVLLEDEGRPNEHVHIQPLKGTVYPAAPT